MNFFPQKRKLRIWSHFLKKSLIKNLFFLQCLNLSALTPQMVKHTQTIRRLLPTNRLSVFDHFVGLALKGSTHSSPFWYTMKKSRFNLISRNFSMPQKCYEVLIHSFNVLFYSNTT